MFVGMGANGASGDYNLENSLRFRSSASAYLSRTPTVAGNRRTFTLSCWVKLSTPDTSMSILSAGTSDADRDALGFSLSRMNTVIVQAGTNPQETTTARFRDPSGWYHAVWSIDTTQAIDSNRIKMYINNELQTNYDTTNYPVLNQEFVINSTAEHRVGKLYYSTDLHQLDGYLTEVNFVDGQALTPSDFGDYNEDTGVWQPKKYTGTYGTNGFYLPMDQTDFTLTAATGGTETIDGDYKVHTFTSSGTFTVNVAGTDGVQYLVVGGGGGGSGGVSGTNYGSGGGAGTIREATGYTVTATAYTVTVGSGGAGAKGTSSAGSSSVFDTITATGGYGITAVSRTGGANDDYAGGTNTTSTKAGGGAGSAANGSLSDGGNGTISTILPSADATSQGVGEVNSGNVYYGGGGGGGNNGIGGLGGGATANGLVVVHADANSGGGGAGGGSGAGGGNGGSGVVIIRYKFQ